MSLWPTLLFSNLSISSRKNTVSHQPFSVLTDFNNFLFTLNFYSQFLPTIFSQISTDLLRSSQVYLAIQPLFFSHFLLGTQSPRSSPIFHRSFKDLSKTFLPPSLFTRYLDSRSFRPTLQFSTDLHRSSPIYLAIHPLFIHYLPVTLSPRSSQIFYRSFIDLLKISLPPSPSTGTWTVGHSGPLFRSPSFSLPPFFKTCISWLILHRSSKILPPLSPSTSFLDSRSFRPTLQIFVCSIFFTLLSGQSVILTFFPRWRIHTKFPTRLP